MEPGELKTEKEFKTEPGIVDYIVAVIGGLALAYLAASGV